MSRPRRSLVAGNWKMHGSRAANAALLQGVRAMELILMAKQSLMSWGYLTMQCI